MKSDSQLSNEDTCSQRDSSFDMDNGCAEEHKELSVSKQEQVDTKTFL